MRLRKNVKIICSIIVCVVLFSICSWYECHYTKYGTVSELDYHDGVVTVTVIDTMGHEWSYDDDEPVNEYAVVKMTMDTMHNDDTITDDEIEKVEYLK